MFDFSLNAPHIHLLFNHFPIVLSTISPLLLMYGMFRQDKQTIHTALVFFVFTPLMTIPTFLSWREAIGIVSGIPGVDIHSLILHESMTGYASVGLFLLWIVSGIVFFRSVNTGRYFLLWYLTILILSFGIFALVATAGYYGGNIRHAEIRG